jgi:hypothetical protein
MRSFWTLVILGALTLPASVLVAVEETPVSPAIVEDDVARQVRIYREAILQGTTERVRSDAAIGMLLNKDAASRDFLVSALRLSDNSGAGKAVCQALIESYAVGRAISSQDVFLVPLMERLVGMDSELARLSADALVIFKYEDIQIPLNTLVRDAALDKRVRANLIYALQVRFEPQALTDLIHLRDEPGTEMLSVVEAALQETFGVPGGSSKQVWEQILAELQEKSPDDIRRERLLRQAMRLRRMQTERDRWQRLYLGTLDKQYETADEAFRNGMVLDRLNSDLVAIRLWALDKIERYPAGGYPVMRDKLLMLLNDESRFVRLKTAQVLNNMSALSPAEKLLERLAIEKDPEVSLAIFEALGEACFFAFSPGSKIELSVDVKVKTLQIAVDYLDSVDTDAVLKSAEVVGKLLGLNNLPPEQSAAYLEQLVKRYQRCVPENSTLRSGLLQVMAKLCDRGVQREQAIKMYLPSFMEAIEITDDPPVRFAAALGLSNIDKAKALEVFKQQGLMEKGSPALRQLIIDAAAQAGQSGDLEWLSVALNSNEHFEQAPQAFVAICQRAPAHVAFDWAGKVGANGQQSAFVCQLLELAESKALGEKNERLLSDVRVRLAEWFLAQQPLEQLTAYLEKLKSSGYGFVFPDATGARLVEAMIYSTHYDLATDIVAVRVELNSLQEDSMILIELDDFFSSDQNKTEEKSALLEALTLQTKSAGPPWTSRLKAWKDSIQGLQKNGSPVAADQK